MSVWEELLEVIVVGAISGVGLSIAFAILVRGVVQAGAARREERTGALMTNLLLATVFGLICAAAVAFAVYEIIDG